MRVLNLILLMLAVSGSAVGEVNRVIVRGRALFSFSPSFYMFQTDDYIYKISKKELSPTLSGEFDRSIESGNTKTFRLPQTAIAFVWPNTQKLLGEDTKRVSEMKDQAVTSGGKIQMTGRSLLTYDKESALVQVGETIFLLKKSSFDPKRRKYIDGLSPGSRFEMLLPSNSVSGKWSFKSSLNREVASVSKDEKMTLTQEGLNLIGTVLCSFADPFALIQSGNYVYQIKKDLVEARDLAAMNKPGSKVDVTLPLKAVEFFWKTNRDGENTEVMQSQI